MEPPHFSYIHCSCHFSPPVNFYPIHHVSQIRGCTTDELKRFLDKVANSKHQCKNVLGSSGFICAYFLSVFKTT